MKIRKGDLVRMSIGKDRGREGRVERVDLKDGLVVVTGVNQYKKHRKPMGDRPGEVVTLDRPIDVSKVALVCPKCKQVTRVGYKTVGDKKVRICRKCDQIIEEVAKVEPKVKKIAKKVTKK